MQGTDRGTLRRSPFRGRADVEEVLKVKIELR